MKNSFITLGPGYLFGPAHMNLVISLYGATKVQAMVSLLLYTDLTDPLLLVKQSNSLDEDSNLDF